MNVLWIMCDQLRFDYLSCAGHPTLKTPNIDALASRGVRFDRAYVQSPICGPSRMSSYTGRYCRSHGSTWNGFPLRIGEPTLGDHLRDLGVRPALVGKTHMIADRGGMDRLGIDPGSDVGLHHSECGFEPFERDDGVHPYGPSNNQNLRYNRYLREHGFDGENPWEDWANSAEGDDGELLSGWLMKYNNLPARVPEEHSETAYMTNRAMAFMEEAGDQPWLCHLSFIKPHWPYIVPAPYHDMYGPDDILPPIRTEAERDPARIHPVFRAFQESRICQTFVRPGVRETVIPSYMGLIKQIDDHLGRLFAWMEARGLAENTMVVFSSDHGDYLGDHWMGEKDLFHDVSVRVPLIVYDPRAEADATRGQVCDELVEYIDLAPTFQEFFGGPPLPHILEGRSLMPLLHAQPGTKPGWRRYAISEYDYSTRHARLALDVAPEDARMIMVCDKDWKYVHAEGFRPMLFDLVNDPDELEDLGDHPDHAATRARLYEAACAWSRQFHTRITVPPDHVERQAAIGESPGMLIAYWDEADFERSFSKPFAERP
ncbi:MAG: alkaline phosphatase family protein [Pseudomonadota bacterium]|nr:alkaline phosphatase family protein [Pseudomonadota bacterium]MEE2859685.1 alkaline phosphatase family protein [Pseudomonadota bacterium]